MVLFCFMMYVAGLSYKVIAVVLVSGSALVLALLLVITQVNFQLPAALDKTIGYQLGRIQDWLSDDATTPTAVSSSRIPLQPSVPES